MGFHMCPLDPKVKKIFIGNEAGLLRKRVPISVRASSSYKKCWIPDIDWQNNSGRKFLLKNNLLSLKILNKVDNNIISTSLSHLIPMFKGKLLHCDVFGKTDRFQMHITLSVEQSLCADDHNAYAYYSPILVFAVSHAENRLDLEWIKSRQSGLGGKMLVALYNIAKDLNINGIFFYPDNRSAEQVYYHMDFGSNNYEVHNRKANDWKVDIK